MRIRVKTVFLMILLLCSSSAVFAVDNFRIGQNAFYSKDYQTAYIQFQKAVTDNPYNENYHYYYAQTLVKLSKLDEAQREYQKIIELAPLSNAAKLSSIGIAKIESYITNKYIDNQSFNSNISNKYRIEDDKDLEDNFIDNASNESGLIVRWNINKMPLKVCFLEAKNVSGFKPSYIKDTEDTFSQWVQNSDSKLSYITVNNPYKADIIISFVSQISSAKNESGETGFLGGLTTPHFSGIMLQFIDIKLTTIKLSNSAPYTDVEMYNIALHEFGHALGIMGHSPKSSDIMYAIMSPNASSEKLSLSKRDINTLKFIYRLDADISNFDPKDVKLKIKDKNSTTIGDVNSRLDKKLQEALEYTKKVPFLPISWTNLGLSYYKMKQYNNALTAFKKALQIDPKYVSAKEGIARIYMEMGDLVNTSLAYQDLIQNDPKNIDYSNNLALFYIGLNRFTDAKNVINALLTHNPDALSNSNIQNIISTLNTER